MANRPATSTTRKDTPLPPSRAYSDTTADTAWFRDRGVVVVGLGRFGGGLGVTRWLAQLGARVTVTDHTLGAEASSLWTPPDA